MYAISLEPELYPVQLEQGTTGKFSGKRVLVRPVELILSGEALR
jgi:hypothetical protein